MMFLMIGHWRTADAPLPTDGTELQNGLCADALPNGTYYFPIGATTIAQNCLEITTEKLRKKRG